MVILGDSKGPAPSRLWAFRFCASSAESVDIVDAEPAKEHASHRVIDEALGFAPRARDDGVGDSWAFA